MSGLVQVAPVPAVPEHDLLTYEVPDLLRSSICAGARVRVPLGRQTRTGVVVGFAEPPPPRGLRAILELLDAEPFLPDDVLELCRWTARYYLASLADVVATVVPADIPRQAREKFFRLVAPLGADEEEALARRAPARAQAYRALKTAPDGELSASGARAAGLSAAALKALVTARVAESIGRPVRVAMSALPDAPAHPLTRAQEAAVAAIATGLAAADAPAPFLLHGVTGSGKTEVFLAAAERAIASGRGALILVPEIALTHQLVERVRGRFGELVAVLHSGLGPSARWEEWGRVRTGAARVVVGARSAVFAPVVKLGLIVVDEEHDSAYKQEDGLRYNARDLAVVRGRLGNAVVVLASATPSAESYHAAREGRHVLLELPERPTAHSLPVVDVIDLRGRPRSGTTPSLLSDELRRGLEANLAAGGQSLVFLNRRGFATYLQCPACWEAANCPHCSVTLTWHRRQGALVCHHCHHHRRPPPVCPACKGPPLAAFGVGTEQIEAALRECYPLAAVDRLDRDAARRLGAQRRILRAWRTGETDILVGTQMVSKGHDVPGVTLAAVLLADLSLNVPDFRAAERTFQLVVQVAGRAGRGDAPGRVVVQTFCPTHPSLVACRSHDYRGFIDGELERRRMLGYPPFARLVHLCFDGRDTEAVERAARAVAADLRRAASELGLSADVVLGPAPAPIARVRGRHRWQVLLRSADVPQLRALARRARRAASGARRATVRLVVDVDPYSMV
jgi:primosomal protein N' (replication factor Y)